MGRRRDIVENMRNETDEEHGWEEGEIVERSLM
jgi:hypothetical protein